MKEKLFRKMEQAKKCADSFSEKNEYEAYYRMYWNGVYNANLDLAFELGYVDMDYVIENRRNHLMNTKN